MASTEQPTVYVVAHGQFGGGDISGSLLTAEGEPLWSHVSSGMGWLRGDLTTNFRDRIDMLAARYPGGYEVEVFDLDTEVPAWLLDANKAWSEANPASDSDVEVSA